MRDYIEHPGSELESSARAFGALLAEDIKNDHDFYIFSPDETSSNKIDAVYNESPRLWLREVRDWEENFDNHGQVLELLSENTLVSTMIGHNLTGGHGIFASYEAFIPIVSSQLDQYLKFLEQCSEVDWRPDYPALNILSTSTCWRQDHNGYSHQNPSIISSLLAKPNGRVNCLFPIDATATHVAHEVMQSTKNVINLITLNKTDEPQWIDINHARWQYANSGASTFGFASDEDPQIIVTAAGDIVSREALYAIKIVKEILPHIRLRFVGITALSYGAIGTTDNRLTQTGFDELFGNSATPIIAAFHGYPDVLSNILTRYGRTATVRGFIEKGSTTTPFDMLARNLTSRYNLVIDILQSAADLSLVDVDQLFSLIETYQAKLFANFDYIREHGVDLPEIVDFRW